MNHSLKKTLVKVTTFCILIGCVCLPSQAQLSGEVDLGGGSAESDTASGGGIKEITVTGIGTTLESAEKQALAAAIRQAVGAYIDSKTLVENEEVIQDRILAVSNAFVEGYETIGQPKKSADGLIEITILAKVKTNQIVQKLKEVNLLSGEVAGQNLWAEASTKVMNAKDAVAMLEAKIPELIKSVVTITPLDNEGRHKMVRDSSGKEVPSTAPASILEDSASGEATLTWYLEMGVDRRYYNETLLPMVSKCLDAIMGVSPKIAVASAGGLGGRLVMNSYKKNASFFRGGGDAPLGEVFPIQQTTSRMPKPESGLRSPYEYGVALIKSISRNFDSMEFAYYPNYKNQLHTGSEHRFPNGNFILCYLNLKVFSNDGELLSQGKIPSWQPFATAGSQISIIGPFAASSRENSVYLQRPIIQSISLQLPIHLLKEIKKVEISLEPIKPNLSLLPSKRRTQ